MKPCDHPIDVAVLRALMADPGQTRTRAELQRALAWLGETPFAKSGNLPAHLAKLERAGLVVQIQQLGETPTYRFNRGSSVRLATGGLDPLAVEPEELLEAFSWRHNRRPEYDPKAWEQEAPGRSKVDRALIQCSSPWQYGQRLRRM